MYKNHNSLLFNLGVIALLLFYLILVFCPEHNTKTKRGTVVLRLKVTPLCTRSARGLSLVSTTSSLASSLE